jgi:hypothetical protein
MPKMRDASLNKLYDLLLDLYEDDRVRDSDRMAISQLRKWLVPSSTIPTTHKKGAYTWPQRYNSSA